MRVQGFRVAQDALNDGQVDLIRSEEGRERMTQVVPILLEFGNLGAGFVHMGR